MDEDDVKVGGIVYLQFMRFPDTGTLDYKLNGRPYLIYKIEGESVFLFEIRSCSYIVDDFFFKITKKSKGGEKRECYVNLSNYVEINISELVNRANQLLSEKKFKNCQKMRFISADILEKISNRIDLLCSVDDYKKRMQKIIVS
jgi:hypothetical protein